MLELQATPVADSPEACKGRYYRYLESAFIGKNGRLVIQNELRPLKSLSCAGCSDCGYQEDDLKESFADSRGTFLEFDDDLKSGDTVYLALVEDSRDWESGHLDDWHYRVKRVTPPQDTPANNNEETK